MYTGERGEGHSLWSSVILSVFSLSSAAVQQETMDMTTQETAWQFAPVRSNRFRLVSVSTQGKTYNMT